MGDLVAVPDTSRGPPGIVRVRAAANRAHRGAMGVGTGGDHERTTTRRTA
jgi:hypothetical protein